jgi:hypothetical protein
MQNREMSDTQPPAQVLAWERRRERIRVELVQAQADVICLQVPITTTAIVLIAKFMPSPIVSTNRTCHPHLSS